MASRQANTKSFTKGHLTGLARLQLQICSTPFCQAIA